jgi:outer membrane protein assembly factor BamB
MRKSACLLVLSFLFLFRGLASAGSDADSSGKAALDWPQWRGANRDAVSLEKGIVDEWPEGGPRVVWRAKIGSGYSSVSVSEGRLYTLWDEKGTQFLFCLDARNGNELWRFELGKGFTNHYGNGPRSTPLIDGGVVFTIGTQGRLVAVDKRNGELVWQRDLVKEYGTKLPSYGYSSSPLIAGDRLVVEAGGDNATFMAFDKKSGKTAWSSQDDRPAYSSPIEVSIDGVRQIVFWSAHGLHSVSPDDGKLLWKHSWETFCPVTGDPLNTGTPIFMAPDRIFISSGSGAAVIRVSKAGETFDVELVWKTEQMRADVNTPLLLGDHIYGFDRGILQCLDARTGEVKWQARGFQRGSLIAADGKLIVLGESGEIAIVDANPEEFVKKDGAKILDGKNWTAPSLAGGKLYLRNHEELLCLEMKG